MTLGTVTPIPEDVGLNLDDDIRRGMEDIQEPDH